MRLVTIEEIYKSFWGLVESRREEIEQSPSGGFEKIYREELDRQFPNFRRITTIMQCSESTARKWAVKYKCRYILHEGIQRVLASDVLKMASDWEAIEAERERKRREKTA